MAAPELKVQVVALDAAPDVVVKLVEVDEAPEMVVREVADGVACDWRVAEGDPAEIVMALG